VGLAMDDVGIFYGHLVYFTAIWHAFWTFGIFCGNFFPVLVCCTKKNLATMFQMKPDQWIVAPRRRRKNSRKRLIALAWRPTERKTVGSNLARVFRILYIVMNAVT
jgi:hypothetical protein